MIDFRNTRFWVALLLALLVALNAVAFVIYKVAYPKQGFALQLWTYAESDTAKLITASLILPLLVFVVEGRFNVAEAVRASRVERARVTQDAQRNARLETITLTSQAWNELFGIATMISSPWTDVDYADLRSKLWNIPNVFQDQLNRWHVRFPNLSTESGLVDSYAFLVNIMVECAASALFHVQTAAHDDERADVRGSIDLIAAGIDQALRGTIPDLLNASLELLAIRESLDLEELRMVESDAEARSLVNTYNKQIRMNIDAIDSWAESVRAHVSRREILATVEGPEVSEFRRLFGEFAAVVREDPSLSRIDDPRWSALQASYDNIPRAERLHAWSVKYSRSWLADLADDLVFNDFRRELEDPARSPSS